MGKVRIDLSRQVLSDEGGSEIPLRPQAFSVLRYFLENPNRLITKDELIAAVWHKKIVSDDSIAQCIHEIRQILGEEGRDLLKTIPRRGYRLDTSATSSPIPDSTKSRTRLVVVGVLVVLASAAIAVGWLGRGNLAPQPGPPTIAVMPFDPIGGDDFSRRLAAGLTDDIITDLARFAEFTVIARSSTERYRGEAVDAREVGKSLGVEYVLEGSIRREDEDLRITAQMIDTNSGNHLWSQRWDRPAADVFAVETEIADAVANRIGDVVEEAGRVKARRKRPADLTAYDLYLLGIEELAQVTPESVQESIRLFKEAIAKDPQLARAWVELYHAHNLSRGYGVDNETATNAALEAAERAVALDPSDAEAHVALGSALANRGEFDRAKASLEMALSLAPNSFEVLVHYSIWANATGDPEGGAEMARKAMRLDPNYPAWTVGPLSYAFFTSGQYEDALTVLGRQRPEQYTQFRWVMRAAALASLGRRNEADETVGRALSKFPDLSIEGFSDEFLNRSDRERFVETMKLAGFPACAPSRAQSDISDEARLTECK